MLTDARSVFINNTWCVVCSLKVRVRSRRHPPSARRRKRLNRRGDGWKHGSKQINVGSGIIVYSDTLTKKNNNKNNNRRGMIIRELRVAISLDTL